jgi:signal transduction histidine kinase
MTPQVGVLSVSPRFRFILPITALIAYFLGLLLYPLIGDTTPILSVLPVVAAGRSLGSRAGLLAALFTTPVNSLVLKLTGHSGWEELIRNPMGILGTAGLIFLGVAVGRLIGLKSEVTAAQAELQQLQDRMSQLRQAERELVDRLSHDLRTPLHTMHGFLELLRGGRVTDPSLQREFLRRASQDADRLAATVEDLLDISLSEEGRLQLTLDQVDLNGLVSELVQLLQAMAEVKNIELTHVRPKPELMVEADRRRLRRALFNLLERAISVSEAGSAVIVAGQHTDGAVTLQVVDRGGGISPEDCPRVFDKHGTLESSEESRWGSTGVGLHAVKLILEAHGGQVSVKSHVGVGSTFHLSIPAKTS